MPPIWFAYYTKNTPYESEAQQLAASLAKWGIVPELIGIDSRGSWQANTSAKPGVILEQLRRHPGRPQVYIDVDADAVERPSLLMDGELDGVDIGAALFDNYVMLSGTLWLGGGPACVAVVSLWLDLCRKYPDRIPPMVHRKYRYGAEAWDQRVLDMAIDQTPSVKFRALPQEYTYLHDLSKEKFPDMKPVIVHTLASRRYREVVGAK